MKYAIVAITAMAAFFVGGSLPLVWFAANQNSARSAVEARSPLQLEEIEPADLHAIRRPSTDPADIAGLLNRGRELVAAGNIPAAQPGGPAGQPQKLKQEGLIPIADRIESNLALANGVWIVATMPSPIQSDLEAV